MNTNNEDLSLISVGLMYIVILVMVFTLFGCASTSNYKQVAEEAPHYGLSAVKTATGTCYIYVERNNGSSVSCVTEK